MSSTPSHAPTAAERAGEERLRQIAARLEGVTPGEWGVMRDGPNGDGKPWRAFREAADGLTIASTANTEPIARLSGYLMPVEPNAEFITHARSDVEYLLTALLAARRENDGYKAALERIAHPLVQAGIAREASRIASAALAAAHGEDR